MVVLLGQQYISLVAYRYVSLYDFVPMGHKAKLKKSLVFHDKAWFSLVFRGFPWFSVMFPGFPGFSLIFPGFPLGFPSFPWFSLVFPGFPLKSLH